MVGLGFHSGSSPFERLFLLIIIIPKQILISNVENKKPSQHFKAGLGFVVVVVVVSLRLSVAA